MSRIEEALRRARAGQAGTPEPTVPEAPEGAPARDTEESPWTFDDHDGRGRRSAQQAEASTHTMMPPERDADRRSHERGDEDADPSLAVFQGFNKVTAEKLVITPTISSTSLEQYRKLAATLHHAQADRGIRTVLVASAVAGEGKTLTSTNLALTFSESYKREVLLVDADLRRPSIHEVFQVPNVSGLTDGLNAELERKLSIIQVSPRLSILTAGKPDPDPMGNLTSPRMRRILEEAAERFDWVIIDTPPVGSMTDANLLAAMVDVAVVVVNAGKTPYQLVQKAVDTLGRDKVLGVVMNRVEAEALGQEYAYGYKGYYGYRYGR